MQKRFLYFLSCITLIIVIFTGCRNDDSIIPDLDPEAKIADKLNTESSLTGIGWKKTQYGRLNDGSKVSMKVVEESITPTGFAFICGNNSDKHVVFREKYTIERNVNDIWYEVPILTDKYDFVGSGFDLPYGQSKELNADWEELYGDLEAGEYRILKEIMDLKGSNFYQNECLAAEFIVK